MSQNEQGGWRAGKPMEDPEKMKSWGYVTARPSEYLVHVRGGRVLTASSGQGASCFKWPRDAVAVVPTSLQQLKFKADQVTLERVGVEVVGIAVYRIAEPLLAYRLLNFSFPERAQQKLEATLTDMFIGSARRIIASLSIDDCLQKRKSALAHELLREIAPVVSGEGRPEDSTDRGWGVVIDTIEIQEVKVLSEKVFVAMQAPFRTSLDQRAREAKAEAEKEIASREARYRRETELARLETEAALRERQAADARVEAERQAEAARAEIERRGAVERAEVDRRAAIERADAEARTQNEVRRRELAALEDEAELAALARKVALFEASSVHERARAALDGERRRAEAELKLIEGQHGAEVARLQALAELPRAEAQARLVVAQNLPQLASAIGQRVGEVRITQIGSENPFGSIAQAIHSVIDLAHSAAGPRRDSTG